MSVEPVSYAGRASRERPAGDLWRLLDPASWPRRDGIPGERSWRRLRIIRCWDSGPAGSLAARVTRCCPISFARPAGALTGEAI